MISDWHTGIPAYSDRRLDRDTGDKLRVILFGNRCRCTHTKDIRLRVTLRTDKSAHIFDDACGRNMKFFEHIQRPSAVIEGNFLRCRDGNTCCYRYRLSQCQLCITCSWRHIDDKHIQFRPEDISQELLDRLHDHRTSPDQRLSRLHQRTHRHHLYTISFHWHHFVALNFRFLIIHTHHPRNVWSIDIGVKEADFFTLHRHRDCQVDSGC